MGNERGMTLNKTERKVKINEMMKRAARLMKAEIIVLVASVLLLSLLIGGGVYPLTFTTLMGVIIWAAWIGGQALVYIWLKKAWTA